MIPELEVPIFSLAVFKAVIKVVPIGNSAQKTFFYIKRPVLILFFSQNEGQNDEGEYPFGPRKIYDEDFNRLFPMFR